MMRHFQRAIFGLLWGALFSAAPALGATIITPAFSQARPEPAPAPSPAPLKGEAGGTPVSGAVSAPAPATPSVPAAVRRPEAVFSPALVYGDQLLVEDTAWRGEVLVEGVLAVAPQATLRIEPGTVVRFRPKGARGALLLVQGRLIATGSKDAPVLFTSPFVQPAPGDWQGILLLGSEKKNQLENCRIEGAATGIDALFSSVTLKEVRVGHAGTGMRFQDTLVAMDGGGASDCDTGLGLYQSEANLREIALTGNRQGLVAFKSSVYLLEGNLSGNQAAAFSGDGSRVKIEGGTLQGNGSGAALQGCAGSITGARLGKNREFGLSLAASRIKVNGNVIHGNGNNGMLVADGDAVAWDNAIFENAGYDLYHAGAEEFRAPANWWGPGVVQPKIFENGGRGRVLYTPVLPARPLPPRRGKEQVFSTSSRDHKLSLALWERVGEGVAPAPVLLRGDPSPAGCSFQFAPFTGFLTPPAVSRTTHNQKAQVPKRGGPPYTKKDGKL